MKYALIQKYLIKQSIILLLILILVGGIAFVVDGEDTAYTQEVNKLQSQTDKILRDTATLREQYAKVGQNMEMYLLADRELKDNKLTLNKMLLRDSFDALRKKYYMDKLKINFASPKALDGDKYKRDSGFIEMGEVSLEVMASSDEDVFSIIDELSKTLAGVKYTSISLVMSRSIDASVIQGITQQGGFALFETKIKFSWYGINTSVPEEPAASSASAPPNVGFMGGRRRPQ